MDWTKERGRDSCGNGKREEEETSGEMNGRKVASIVNKKVMGHRNERSREVKSKEKKTRLDRREGNGSRE